MPVLTRRSCSFDENHYFDANTLNHEGWGEIEDVYILRPSGHCLADLIRKCTHLKPSGHRAQIRPPAV